jgi:hypothetical protein
MGETVVSDSHSADGGPAAGAPAQSLAVYIADLEQPLLAATRCVVVVALLLDRRG